MEALRHYWVDNKKSNGLNIKTMNIFKEKGEYSWRKIMTAVTLVCFAAAQIGFLVTHNFSEMPTAYWSVDAGVFLSYFGKDAIRTMKIINKVDPKASAEKDKTVK